MSEVVALTLRVPRDLHPRMRVRAAVAGQSLNAWITAALVETVELEEEEEREQPARPAQTAPAGA